MRGWLGSVVMALSFGFVTGCAHAPPRPDDARYPNLVHSWDAIQTAKVDLHRAEEVHRTRGRLGGHAALAVLAIDAAQRELDEAVRFAERHTLPGSPGVPTEKPPITAAPDDVRYQNLGNARIHVEWAIRHVEDAMQVRAPIGGLGGHGERTVEHLRHANIEIREAEHFADTHR